MAGYVFVSYSRDDREYVDLLDEYLQERSIDTWVDRSDIERGARWQNEIQSAIDNCAAFLIVMTPAADAAKWPREELAWAESKGKPIHGLLLRGRAWFGYTTINLEELLDGALPSEKLLAVLPGYTPASTDPKVRETVENYVQQGRSLGGLDLRQADLHGAVLAGADMRNLDLSGADLSRADLSNAILSGSNLTRADLSQTLLTNARLVDARLAGATLFATDLSGADARRVDMSRAQLVGTSLDGCSLDGARVFGISAWNVAGAPASSKDLLVTEPGEPAVAVDHVGMAQVIHLLFSSPAAARDLVDTLGSKVVLIFGRFTGPRERILDAMRDALRARDLTPVMFDFRRTGSELVVDAIEALAQLARFVVADLTDPSAIPHNLAAVLPSLSTPLVLLQQKGGLRLSVVKDIEAYPWVVPVCEYHDAEELIPEIDRLVIQPAEAKLETLEPAHQK